MKHIRSDMNAIFTNKKACYDNYIKCHYAESIALVEVKVAMDKS